MYIITGGGSGIGQALANILALKGKRVLIIGRNEKNLVETAKTSDLITYYKADVTSSIARQKIKYYLRNENNISGLINNAGIINPIKSVFEIKAKEWKRVFKVNVEAPLLLTQILQDKLCNARVLNISSGAAHFPVVGWSAYCSSKAALSMLTQCMQSEAKDIAFASVMPGIIDTNMQALIRDAKNMTSKKRDFFIELKRDSRLISTDTVAAFLSWLLLDIDKDTYISKEWDIYDKSNHKFWLKEPYFVPEI